MPERDSSLNISLATMAVSAIRNWWNTFQLDKSDTNNSSTEEDEGELAEMRQLSTNLKKTLRTRQLEIDFNGGRPVLSLRAPQDLVSFPSISRPRWPIECEVISDIIHHIEWDPPEPETFYQPTGHERTPMPVGEERGKVVYCVDQATKRPFFTCSRVGGSRGPIKGATSCDIDQADFTLEFESRFESGNLQKAVQVGDYEYELTLCTDTYTKKHTQWFYFRVRNMEAGVTYRFTIINLMKRSCLYSVGLRPLFYSERAAKEEGVGWQRTGSNIRYYRNCSQDSNENDTIALYSLTWTLRFPHDSDTCYLAHCYPYTYSHLQRYLQRVSSNPAVASYCKLRVLCHSLAGNAVYVMNITSQGDGNVKGRTKKAVVVTARVHPGETNSSWMMEGLLDFLLGDSSDAQLLRDTFVFKVVPMLNPDGVVVGNYRCSLAGRDLNRNYKTLLRDSFPCVWHIRNMVERLMAETDVALYCDFHGHNRKNNVFMYGCNNRGEGSPKLHERVFPLMMSKNANNKFSFKSCKFKVQKSKEGTGRIAMWRLGIRNSYTMEATFGGSTLGDRGGTHFTTRDLKSMGYNFCDTLLDFCDPDPTKTTYCLTELATLLRKEAGERLGKDLGPDCNISESDLETSTSGSNSSDSDGLPAHLLNQPETVHLEFPTNCCTLPKQNPVKKKKKKKRLKSRKERNKQRPEGAKNDTQPQTLQESCLPHETTVKESVTERPVGRHRTKWLVNSVMKKAVMPPPNTGDVSQVTLWQGCEPVKDDGLENTRAAHSPQRAKASPHTGDLGLDTGQWRCSSQLLHLSALIPAAKLLHPHRRQHHYPGQSPVSYKLYGGLLPPIKIAHRSPSSTCVNMVPDMIQTKRLLSSFTSDNRRFIFGARGSLRVSASYSVLEDAFPSHTDATTIKRQNGEQEDDPTEVGLSLWGCKPLEEQKQRDMRSDGPLRETEPRSTLSGLRATNLSGKRLCKDAQETKRQLDVSRPVSKPPDFMKVKHPQRDTLSRLQAQGITGRKSTAPQAEMVAIRKPSQSTPLITPKRQQFPQKTVEGCLIQGRTHYI
ncbi:cytosolic carboxypeptidase 2 isoform X2 [Hippoglossus hippoglossus]|uniref:cytosolic carboxypeptidase 2 isoform X2 n=1 Tax=Hippoglossus hippoglossus TaxID=8267 RepID=UPI00148C3055|nr:cytosolic carboxypeptidase 2 isoform X2 [Hippoglossus hippoglossus]